MVPLTLSRLISLALFLGIFIPNSIAQVRANPSQTLLLNSVARITFDPPKDGLPDDTAEGASRGNNCDREALIGGVCVTPLVPATKTQLTVTERPTFFVYVPQTSAKELFFGLIDEDNNFHYQSRLSLSNQTGILSFKLPDDAPPLTMDKQYRWVFIMIDERGLRPDSPGVRGEIRRIALSSKLKQDLQNKSPLERASLYGKNGIWQDMLASIAEARRLEPTNPTLASTWQDLLNSVGLEAIATQPLLN